MERTAGQREFDLQQQQLLSRKISELSLVIPGTRLETLVDQLYAELEAAGISLRPSVYIADEWGCPDGVPAIGIPFYLAMPELHKLEGDLTGLEVEEETEAMMTLRHEAGHAFNYAHLLYKLPKWREVFGGFTQPYRDDYKAVPFSAKFVRHLPGWYAQKHPDEDFAETFAVWLTPDSDWRAAYDGTPALAKLECMAELAREFGRREPLVKDDTQHMPVHQMTMTLQEWYSARTEYNDFDLPHVIDNDLRNLFPAREGEAADEALWVYRKKLIREIHNWSGIAPELIRALVEKLIARIQLLGLKMNPEQKDLQMLGITAFVTALVMNHLHRGRFVDS